MSQPKPRLVGDDGELLNIVICSNCGMVNDSERTRCKRCRKSIVELAVDTRSRLARISQSVSIVRPPMRRGSDADEALQQESDALHTQNPVITPRLDPVDREAEIAKKLSLVKALVRSPATHHSDTQRRPFRVSILTRITILLVICSLLAITAFFAVSPRYNVNKALESLRADMEAMQPKAAEPAAAVPEEGQTHILPVSVKRPGHYGSAVAIHGNFAAVGANAYRLPNAALTGAVYLYERDASNNWQEQALITPPEREPKEEASWRFVNAQFGKAVALTDSLLAIGAPGNGLKEHNGGFVYLYTLKGDGTWTLQQTVQSTAKQQKQPAEGANFPINLALDETTLLVNEPALSDETLVYIKKDGTWLPNATLASTGPIALNGNTAVIGDGVYERQNDRWKKVYTLTRGSSPVTPQEVAVEGALILALDEQGPLLFRKMSQQWQEQPNTLSLPQQLPESTQVHIGLQNGRVFIGLLPKGIVYVYTFAEGSWRLVEELSIKEAQRSMGGGVIAITGSHIILGMAPDGAFIYHLPQSIGETRN